MDPQNRYSSYTPSLCSLSWRHGSIYLIAMIPTEGPLEMETMTAVIVMCPVRTMTTVIAISEKWQLLELLGLGWRASSGAATETETTTASPMALTHLTWMKNTRMRSHAMVAVGEASSSRWVPLVVAPCSLRNYSIGGEIEKGMPNRVDTNLPTVGRTA